MQEGYRKVGQQGRRGLIAEEGLIGEQNEQKIFSFDFHPAR